MQRPARPANPRLARSAALRPAAARRCAGRRILGLTRAASAHRSRGLRRAPATAPRGERGPPLVGEWDLEQGEGAMMSDYAVIDSDGHVHESLPGLTEFLDPRWRRAKFFPGDIWDRDLRGKLGENPRGPGDQLAALDADAIDVTVMYPTAALSVGVIRELDFATALTRAYND